jgi:hypothetical protein
LSDVEGKQRLKETKECEKKNTISAGRVLKSLEHMQLSVETTLRYISNWGIIYTQHNVAECLLEAVHDPPLQSASSEPTLAEE